MKKNLVATIVYPIVFWLTFAGESYILATLGINTVDSVVSIILFALPFLVSPIASGWVAESRPIKIAVLGSLLHQIIIITFAPVVIDYLLGSPDGASQTFLSSLSQVDIDLATRTLQILAIVFLPILMLLAVLGGYIGSKLRSLNL
jgi:hypothetical protein